MAGQATYTDPLLASYCYLVDASGAVQGVNAMRVWDDDHRGAGVIVAAIDDGVERTSTRTRTSPPTVASTWTTTHGTWMRTHSPVTPTTGTVRPCPASSRRR